MTKDFVVLDIAERLRMGDLNKMETYFVFRVKTAKGTVFTTRLNEDQLDDKVANALIGAKAHQLDKLKD